jgi:2-polyprenyl-3-methyl-5-hydroxy-6-metoxy-1,4-benzoquinol methylase
MMLRLPQENIYGHTKRLRWILSHLKKGDVIVELGCGTGYMITLPLAQMGFAITGVDLDRASIALGQECILQERQEPSILRAVDLSELDVVPDVVIASEVLEHLPHQDLDRVLTVIRSKLRPNGRLLVTVPNGYGWFEMEHFLWFDLGLGSFLERTRIAPGIRKLKQMALGKDTVARFPSTLANSPHVQRFTYNSMQKLLRAQGYEVIDAEGSVLAAGPFGDLLFSGVKPVMKLDCALGKRFPRIAAGFYYACRLTD